MRLEALGVGWGPLYRYPREISPLFYHVRVQQEDISSVIGAGHPLETKLSEKLPLCFLTQNCKKQIFVAYEPSNL